MLPLSTKPKHNSNVIWLSSDWRRRTSRGIGRKREMHFDGLSLFVPGAPFVVKEAERGK